MDSPKDHDHIHQAGIISVYCNLNANTPISTQYSSIYNKHNKLQPRMSWVHSSAALISVYE